MGKQTTLAGVNSGKAAGGGSEKKPPGHGIFEVPMVSDRAREMRKLEKALYCRTINVVQKSQFQP